MGRRASPTEWPQNEKSLYPVVKLKTVFHSFLWLLEHQFYWFKSKQKVYSTLKIHNISAMKTILKQSLHKKFIKTLESPYLSSGNLSRFLKQFVGRWKITPIVAVIHWSMKLCRKFGTCVRWTILCKFSQQWSNHSRNIGVIGEICGGALSQENWRIWNLSFYQNYYVKTFVGIANIFYKIA